MWIRNLASRARKPLKGVAAGYWLFLILLAVGLALFLATAQKPWEGELGGKLAAGERLKFKECITVGLWAAAAVNLVAVLLAMALLPWLKRVTQVPAAGAAALPGIRFSWLHWAGLAAILVVALALRLPTFTDGVHRDEQDTLRRNTFGYEELQADGTFKFKKKKWRDVLWENGGANNPVLYSITSRLCLEALWKTKALPRNRFSITAVRLPSLVAGILAIGALWYLLMSIGLPETAWVTALLAAIHPMHIDYSAEARGYAFVLLFTVIQLIALHGALRSGHWKYWAWYGLSQFLLLYSNPGSLYFPLVLNLCVLGILAWRWHKARPVESPEGKAGARAQIARCLAANAVSALVFLQLMAPCIPQMLHYFKITSVRGPMAAVWMFQVLSQYTTGLFLFFPSAEGAGAEYLSSYIWREFTPAQPLVTPWVMLIMPAFFVLGLVALWSRGTIPRLIVIISVISPVLCYLHHAKLTGLYLYYWYVIFALPALLIVWGAGITLPFKSLAARGSWQEGGKGRVRGFLLSHGWMLVPLVALPIYFLVTSEGRSQLDTGDGTPYVQILRGKNKWLVYPEGRMVLHPSRLATDEYESPARAEEAQWPPREP